MGALSQIKDELKYEILGIALVALGVLGIVCLLLPDAGLLSGFIEKTLKSIAGEGRFIFPFLLILIGAKLVRKRAQASISERMYGVILLFLVALALFHLVIPVEDSFSAGLAGDGGGLIGALISFVTIKSFGIIGTYVILITFGLIALLLLTNLSTAAMVKSFTVKVRQTFKNAARGIMNFLFEEVEDEDEKAAEPSSPVIIDHEGEQFSIVKRQSRIKEKREKEKIPVPPATKKNVEISSEIAEESITEEQKEAEEIFPVFTKSNMQELSSFQLPPISILARSHRIKNNRMSKDISENIRILEETLESFGVKAKILQVSRGPAITRYEIQPPPGVKVSRIVSLADDIALSMAAPDVRIEAPIPGKAAVGIEVPNKEISMVHLRDLLESQEFVQSGSKLTIALGKDIAGNPEVADLAKMPHLLIAGATGSGKSVCLNTLIASILFKATPDEVKLLMIDPKMVELATYNGIPHLVYPVVTDSKKAATALRWAVREMERRYEFFAQAGVRDITRYNKLFKNKEPGGGQPLPMIVVIIDELADLMMVAPADVEDAVCRLAQMARAAGIHLVVATQRPSVDVITGLIKANIPSRISFAVSSQIDSRTILDMAGAEKLLGKGDMLFYPVGASKPVRIQGAYLSDREVEDLVNYLKKQAEPVYDEEILSSEPEGETMPQIEDELLPQAVKILIESGHASISMLQRRLHIGYARAARLIDIMEQRGIVGGYEGSKPRSILMTLEQYNQVFRKAK
ncbi:MAG: DNA translocase FtsK [Desulfotomaculaceae bacterium]|nr:DNA translocase FtsK [Desulfotomaculaceae bacterium]MDD4765971.1 DNA translocase FtsK [Desulfotomaculaceae bacterium]